MPREQTAVRAVFLGADDERAGRRRVVRREADEAGGINAFERAVPVGLNVAGAARRVVEEDGASIRRQRGRENMGGEARVEDVPALRRAAVEEPLEVCALQQQERDERVQRGALVRAEPTRDLMAGSDSCGASSVVEEPRERWRGQHVKEDGEGDEA